MHGAPAPHAIVRHPVEIGRLGPQRNPDQRIHSDHADLAIGNGLAAEFVVDAGGGRRQTRNHSRPHHHHQGALTLAIAAADAGHAGQQNEGGHVGVIGVIENDPALFDCAHRHGKCKFGELRRREPGQVTEALQLAGS